jgi:Sortase domain
VADQARHGQRLRRVLPLAGLLVAGTAVVVVTASNALTSAPSPGPADPPPPARPTVMASPVSGASWHTSAAVHGLEPRRLSIETLGVSADIVTVGLRPDGALDPPGDAADVGWYPGGSKPGEIGPAVLVGHLDSPEGDGVFARLAQLSSGDVVTVEGANGSVATFAVYSVTSYPRDDFPSETVYGATPDAQLRLITCGGAYRKGHGYEENVVVAASLVS